MSAVLASNDAAADATFTTLLAELRPDPGAARNSCRRRSEKSNAWRVASSTLN